MIGIHMPGLAPAELLHGGRGGGPDGGRFAADDQVLPVGFVPDGYDFHAPLRRQYTSPELRGGLLGETIADAE